MPLWHERGSSSELDPSRCLAQQPAVGEERSPPRRETMAPEFHLEESHVETYLRFCRGVGGPGPVPGGIDEDDPAVCGSVNDLKASVESAKDIDLTRTDGVDDLKSAIGDVEDDLAQVRTDAKSQFSSQLDAVDASWANPTTASMRPRRPDGRHPDRGRLRAVHLRHRRPGPHQRDPGHLLRSPGLRELEAPSDSRARLLRGRLPDAREGIRPALSRSTVRFSPVLGSKRWILVPSTQISASSPSLIRLAPSRDTTSWVCSDSPSRSRSSWRSCSSTSGEPRTGCRRTSGRPATRPRPPSPGSRP